MYEWDVFSCTFARRVLRSITEGVLFQLNVLEHGSSLERGEWVITQPALLLGCRAAQHLMTGILEQFAARDGTPIVVPCLVEVRDFPNTEVGVTIKESVRGRDVIVVQAPCAYQTRSLDAALREFLLLCDALFRASAARITGVLTMFPYQRQERKDRPRTPISAKRVAVEIQLAMGSALEKRIVAVDLHAPAIQGYFEIPFDALSASTELVPHVAAHKYFTVLAPDVGAALRGEQFVRLLEDYRDPRAGHPEVQMAVMYKRRRGPERVEVGWVAGAQVLAGKDVVIVDDLLATGGTAREAFEKARALGAQRVALAVTHAECTGNVLRNVEPFDDVFVTDSLPLDRLPQPLPRHWHVVPLAPLLAEAITQILRSGTVSGLENRHLPLPT